ncbi:MAG TPA: PspC domain-containing protein [Candidatus Saccharimonadales bacterium]|nr:PspC domain-containing protein [Candidatus Saccharimonadales bacterium]
MNHLTITKHLYRSASDKKIAGVCGGIGIYLDIDPTLVRLAWIVLTVLTGVVPGVIGYFIAAIVMPKEPGSLQ